MRLFWTVRNLEYSKGRGHDRTGYNACQSQLRATRTTQTRCCGAGRGEGPGQSILLEASGDLHGADLWFTPAPALTSCVVWGKWLDLSISVSLFVNEQWLSHEVAMEIK